MNERIKDLINRAELAGMHTTRAESLREYANKYKMRHNEIRSFKHEVEQLESNGKRGVDYPYSWLDPLPGYEISDNERNNDERTIARVV